MTWLAADATINSTLITAVVTCALGIFGGGGLVALLKVNADKGKIVIEASQGAVVVQTSVIHDLQAELQRVKGELADLRLERASEQARWETEMATQRAEQAAERAQWRTQDAQLRQRISAVERAADGEP